MSENTTASYDELLVHVEHGGELRLQDGNVVCSDCGFVIAEQPIDTSNDLLAGTNGERVTVMFAEQLATGVGYDVALRLAAWIVAMVDPLDRQWSKLLRAVMET